MTDQENEDNQSLAESYYSTLSYDDPVFLKLKTLLQTGRRSEALKLIRENDDRFGDPQAQELVTLIMGTLRDTIIDP